MAEFDYKEYARRMRENCVKDENGVIRVSPELWEQIAGIIENIPTADVVEVVRCKNCKFRGTDDCSNSYYLECEGAYVDPMEDDDFCSYGEKK